MALRYDVMDKSGSLEKILVPFKRNKSPYACDHWSTIGKAQRLTKMVGGSMRTKLGHVHAVVHTSDLQRQRPGKTLSYRLRIDNYETSQFGKETVKQVVLVRDTNVPDHGLPTKASSQ